MVSQGKFTSWKEEEEGRRWRRREEKTKWRRRWNDDENDVNRLNREW